jgi:O-antigen/teichoic acid export membrane protein
VNEGSDLGALLAMGRSHLARGAAFRHSTGIRLVLNTASNFLGQALVLVATFLSTPYVTRKLGAAQYGTLSLLVICIYSMSMLNLGVNTSLIKYLAELMPKGEMEEVQQYFSTAFTMLAGLGVLVGVVLFAAAAPIVSHFFRDAGQFTGAIHTAFRISCVAFVLQFLTQLPVAVAAGAQRFDILSLVGTASDTTRIAGMVIVVYFGGGIVALIALTMAVSFLTCTTYAFVCRRLVPQISFRPAFSLRHCRSLLKHSRFVLVGNTSRQLVGSADNAIIGYCLPVANLAYYGIAYSIAQRLWTLVGNVASVVFPAASAFSGSAQNSQVQELYLRSAKIAAAVACFPALMLAMFSRELMHYWLSAEYSANAAVVLSCLSIGFLLNSLSFVPYQTLQSTFYAAATAKASIIYAVVNVVLFLLLIPHYGILGAAAAFVISQVVYVPWFTRLADRRLGVHHWAVILAYVRVAAVSILACALAGIFRSAVHSLFSLALVVALAILFYLPLGYRFILDRKERDACRSAFRELFTNRAREAAAC